MLFENLTNFEFATQVFESIPEREILYYQSKQEAVSPEATV